VGCGGRANLVSHTSTIGHTLDLVFWDYHRAGWSKRATRFSFRDSCAIRLLEEVCDIRPGEELLSLATIKTAVIYTHGLIPGGRGVPSLRDGLRSGWESGLGGYSVGLWLRQAIAATIVEASLLHSIGCVG